jgi:hypothetical protein
MRTCVYMCVGRGRCGAVPRRGRCSDPTLCRVTTRSTQAHARIMAQRRRRKAASCSEAAMFCMPAGTLKHGQHWTADGFSGQPGPSCCCCASSWAKPVHWGVAAPAFEKPGSCAVAWSPATCAPTWQNLIPGTGGPGRLGGALQAPGAHTPPGCSRSAPPCSRLAPPPPLSCCCCHGPLPVSLQRSCLRCCMTPQPLVPQKLGVVLQCPLDRYRPHLPRRLHSSACERRGFVSDVYIARPLSTKRAVRGIPANPRTHVLTRTSDRRVVVLRARPGNTICSEPTHALAGPPVEVHGSGARHSC